jgi:sirohydrochlorin cobaltochelatase
MRLFLSWALALVMSLALAGGALAEGHGHKQPAKKAMLLVTFGTSVPTAQQVFATVDQAFKRAFPGVEIRWAYTSKMIRDKVAKTQGKTWLSPAEALAKLMADGYNWVVVQSLHVIPGAEYHDLAAIVMGFKGMKYNRQFVLGYPLCATTGDLKAVVKVLAADMPAGLKKGEAVVYMGHGTHHPAGVAYAALAYLMAKKSPYLFMGTVEGYPAFKDVLADLKSLEVKKAYLLPFMTVAGDHAVNDMAGDDPESWQSMLRKNGIQAVPVIKAITQNPAMVDIFIQHAKVAYKHLK